LTSLRVSVGGTGVGGGVGNKLRQIVLFLSVVRVGGAYRWSNNRECGRKNIAETSKYTEIIEDSLEDPRGSTKINRKFTRMEENPRESRKIHMEFKD